MTRRLRSLDSLKLPLEINAALDLGNPQLSMHSIRETSGTHDVEHAIKLFEAFLSNYSALESKILVE